MEQLLVDEDHQEQLSELLLVAALQEEQVDEEQRNTKKQQSRIDRLNNFYYERMVKSATAASCSEHESFFSSPPRISDTTTTSTGSGEDGTRRSNLVVLSSSSSYSTSTSMADLFLFNDEPSPAAAALVDDHHDARRYDDEVRNYGDSSWSTIHLGVDDHDDEVELQHYDEEIVALSCLRTKNGYDEETTTASGAAEAPADPTGAHLSPSPPPTQIQEDESSLLLLEDEDVNNVFCAAPAVEEGEEMIPAGLMGGPGHSTSSAGVSKKEAITPFLGGVVDASASAGAVEQLPPRAYYPPQLSVPTTVRRTRPSAPVLLFPPCTTSTTTVPPDARTIPLPRAAVTPSPNRLTITNRPMVVVPPAAPLHVAPMLLLFGFCAYGSSIPFPVLQPDSTTGLIFTPSLTMSSTSPHEVGPPPSSTSSAAAVSPPPDDTKRKHRNSCSIGNKEVEESCMKDQKLATENAPPPEDDIWMAMFERAKQFKAKHGHCWIPLNNNSKRSATRNHDDDDLRRWARTQRASYSPKKSQKSSLSSNDRDEERPLSNLPTERIALLNSIGFIWDYREIQWWYLYHELVNFKSETGHTQVPAASRKNQALASWVRTQRRNFTQRKLSPERLEALNLIGFEFNVKPGRRSQQQ